MRLGLCLVIFLTACQEKALEIELVSPQAGEVVQGVVPVRIAVLHDDFITRAEYYVNDSLERTILSEPFTFYWNTFPVRESVECSIFAWAYDRDVRDAVSDTIQVTIDNGPALFADDFEMYTPGTYPDYSGWYGIWEGAGKDCTYVTENTAHDGQKCFRLQGTSWPRTDGVGLNLEGTENLTYECSVMISPTQTTGALFGFFVLVEPNVGEIFNGVLFECSDQQIYVRGISAVSTGRTWIASTWYSLRVSIDYTVSAMSVWLDDELIISDLAAAAQDISCIFAIATEYGTEGSVFFDDVKIYDSSPSASSR